MSPYQVVVNGVPGEVGTEPQVLRHWNMASRNQAVAFLSYYFFNTDKGHVTDFYIIYFSGLEQSSFIFLNLFFLYNGFILFIYEC